MNVYARGKDVFDDRAVVIGELFAAPAAVAVHNAQVLAQALALTTELQNALASRPVIDQAIGVIRSRTGASSDEAFTWLREISLQEHTQLADEAGGRARARHSDA